MNIGKLVTWLFSVTIEIGKSVQAARDNSLILFPLTPNRLNCGICALVAYKSKAPEPSDDPLEKMNTLAARIGTAASGAEQPDTAFAENYLGGDGLLDQLMQIFRQMKTHENFIKIFFDDEKEAALQNASENLKAIIGKEKIENNRSVPDKENVATVSRRLEKLEDIAWLLDREILDNISKIRSLANPGPEGTNIESVKTFKNINAVLNSLDRLEVRGRDSAGISILFTFTREEFENYRKKLLKEGLTDNLKQRTNRKVLTNNSITIHDARHSEPADMVTVSFVYKYAAEIGALGVNVAFIRNQIKNDRLLQLIFCCRPVFNTISSHTRWASVGDITEANCHPVDNEPTDKQIGKTGIIHVSLNGDIDNYLELKTEYEARYDQIHPEITTDTKLIPLQIEHYLKEGARIEEAFRLAVNDFEGSHAISMHTDMAPGKIFLAQKGSGQALFVGVAPDHYIAASELYGIVEETRNFIQLKGEKKGQIVILDQNCPGGTAGITSFYYDNTPLDITEEDIRESRITSRDIDRQHYPHYFLKEIYEAPRSVARTMENKWRKTEETGMFETHLDTTVIPASLETAFRENRIKRIFFIGQGTAGVAAQSSADLLNHYLGDTAIEIKALKSSEFSGFSIKDDATGSEMNGDLVIAVSQSGTTTDTNRAVDMVKSCGAHTISVVNRRDSDLSFKTDGVLYTSSGRDIEMSVASTKAFYSQITAGAILGLHLAALTHTRPPEFITDEINELLSLPEKMEKILGMKADIRQSAERTAVNKTYWATVGSGANKSSADEIRIKLSELCYKTISSDYIEDKKHIDLSAEPLIIICAAGTRESVLTDIIKDTAIFHAHKAAPLVITTEGENRFDLYAEDVFKIPRTREHLSPVLNTLVGHLWGYYAALAINESSRFMYASRVEIQEILDEYLSMGHDMYEVLLEKKFRESIAEFYNKFARKRRDKQFPDIMGLDTVSNITLLSKYLSGRLPVADFEMDFRIKGTPANMIDAFFESLGHAVKILARPIDAIKHQAKTVTVGTSRTKEKFEGVVFDEIFAHDILISQITNQNVVVLKNIQEILSEVKGSLLYRISGLNILGEPTSETKIEVLRKMGSLKNATSRVETDARLKGTKHIIIREGNVYLGKGRKDGKSILVIPVLSSSTLTPNKIEYILSLNVAFKPPEEISLLKKIKALGGKYTRIKDLILETETLKWDNNLLNTVEVASLFGDSAEKIAESIINQNL